MKHIVAAALLIVCGVASPTYAGYSVTLPSGLTVAAGSSIDVVVTYSGDLVSLGGADLKLQITHPSFAVLPTFSSARYDLGGYVFNGAAGFSSPALVGGGTSAASRGVMVDPPGVNAGSGANLAKFVVNCGASVQAGTYTLSFVSSGTELVDGSTGEPLSLDAFQSVSLNVTSNVPEPAVVAQMLALIGTGGPVVLGRRYWLRRKVKAA